MLTAYIYTLQDIIQLYYKKMTFIVQWKELKNYVKYNMLEEKKCQMILPMQYKEVKLISSWKNYK